MLHANRVFHTRRYDTPEHLAQALTEMTWPLCTGFRLGGLLFLNDAFSENGAQEYAVIRMESLLRLPKPGQVRIGGRQVESVTFSWCTPARAETIIREIQEGHGVDLGPLAVRLDQSPDHGCPLCA